MLDKQVIVKLFVAEHKRDDAKILLIHNKYWHERHIPPPFRNNSHSYITLSYWFLLDVAVHDHDDYEGDIDDEKDDEARVQEDHYPGSPSGVQVHTPEAVDLPPNEVHHVAESLQFNYIYFGVFIN